MGDCSFNLEQYENTIEYYSKYLETADDNEKVDKGKVYFYRGVSHIQLEKYEEAVNDFSSAIELSYQPELSAFNEGWLIIRLIATKKPYRIWNCLLTHILIIPTLDLSGVVVLQYRGLQ